MDERTTKTRESLSRLVRKSWARVKSICTKGRIKIPILKSARLTRVLTNFFSEKCREGHESLNRRFLLTRKHSLVRFQSQAKEIKMPLTKLIATLSLDQNQLFSFLLTSSKSGLHVTPFSKGEKLLIKNFVRFSGLKQRDIACGKIRLICR